MLTRRNSPLVSWMVEVARVKPEIDAKVGLLTSYGARIEPDDETLDSASLHYRAIFLVPEVAVVTVGLILMDWQTDSEVVVETMTTLPESARGHGYGSHAIGQILKWAADQKFNEVRATQVSDRRSAHFWEKNEFDFQPAAEGDNETMDFVYPLE